MARDAVTVTALSLNAGTTTPTGTTINTTNGAVITLPAKARKMLIRVTNTITNATKTVTVKAGEYPAAPRQGLGDLAVVVAQSNERIICIETARFAQDDGTVNVDFSTGMTGTISAMTLPSGA